ncbi:MAG: molybdopterin-dependent oxidoreductase [Acidobacteria bacterium]|nr:molybdopterin-dependent oxidoreductase [Acidobacteriota bacterium]
MENMTDSLNRRNFLKLVGLSGVASTVGCGTPPSRKLISLVMPSEEIVPGEAIWYATTCRECLSGCGMRVRTREGRVTKVEGNPEHPISQGGLCIRGQASLQGLYNPDRIQSPFRRNANGTIEPLGWAEAESQLADRLSALENTADRNKIVFLSGHNGDTLDRLIRQWMTALHSEHYLIYEPFSLVTIKEANRIAFGRAEVPDYSIAEADYLLSFGADFLETWLSPVGFSRGFAAIRNYREDRRGKIVQVEPRLSLTGANADEWVSLQPGTEMWIALAMARYIVTEGLSVELPPAEIRRLGILLEPYSSNRASSVTQVPEETIERLATEFAGASAGLAIGGGVAVTGDNATATQVAINLLNHVTGRVGQTIRFDRSFQVPDTAGLSALRGLVDSINRGEVEVLFIHHTNPIFNLPPDLGFSAALQKVPLVVSFSSFSDETTDLAHLVLPDHTPLEQWGDFRPAAGVHSLMQPAMNPVFDTRSTGDVLLELAKQMGGDVAEAFQVQTFQDYLKDAWKQTYGEVAGEDFENFWQESLLRGGIWPSRSSGMESQSVDRRARVGLLPQIFDFPFPPAPTKGPAEFFLHAYPSSRYYDGRGANKPWLHEIPDPITNVVWDSWVEVHPETARQLNVVEGDLLHVESAVGHVEAPVYIYEGVRPDTVAIPIGLGHESYGRYAKDRGSNPSVLLPVAADPLSGTQVWSGSKVKISKTGRRSELVRTDGSRTDLDRGFSRIIPLSALTATAVPSEEVHHQEPEHESLSMYPPHDHKDYRWGMAINLSSCTGCGACVAACYAENNVPVVGKELIARGRHMAWIRIERYMENVSATPDIRFSPMMCQQCDNAPCEPVCPVYATMHSSDGLNVQVYNRCVGTRYCSNNCPYKVRTFNWFDYQFPEPLHLQLNPDVSVRSKGIMEKCTFCIQRIREGKDHAKDEGRLVRDGEVVPACAQSCPTQAIVFGNLLDPNSTVSKLADQQHGYRVLEELNTKPAITYLPRIKRI